MCENDILDNQKHTANYLLYITIPDPSVHQIPRILGQLRWTLTQYYWASKSQPGYPRILGGLMDRVKVSGGGMRTSDIQE
jgi:hypothetical protein